MGKKEVRNYIYARPAAGNFRSAYLSLKRNMRWLWTFYDNPQLHISEEKKQEDCLKPPIKNGV